MSLIPNGLIIMWSGNLSNIPEEWVLCDGQNETPNLMDLFVVCSGNSFTFNSTGGSANTVAIPSHSHTVTALNSGGSHGHAGLTVQSSGNGTSVVSYAGPGRTEVGGSAQSVASTSTNNNHGHSGGTVNNAGESGTGKNLPPYYALIYIMYGGE